MRKLLLLLALIVSLCANAEKLVGVYYNSTYDKEFRIEVSERDGTINAIYVEIKAEKSKTCYIKIPTSKLSAFVNALIKMRDCQLSWAVNAIKNKEMDITKEMPEVKFPLVTILWEHNGNYKFCYNVRITPIFMLKDRTCMTMSFGDLVSNSNEYITDTYIFAFTNPQDIDTLSKILDIEKLQKEM